MKKGYHDLLRPEILNLIPYTSKAILDLGCGTGTLGKALKKRQPCIVTGIELDKEAAETATKNLDICFCDNLNRYDPALRRRTYDCIVLADILEHLISPWPVLKKFVSVLEENGSLVASLPNMAHPYIVRELQRGLFRYQPAGILDVTHLRFFTKTTIGQLFYQAGLKIIKIDPWPSEKNPIQYHITAIKPPQKFPPPLATILILTYNAWAKTAQCISSIKSTTEVPCKILVIDNGSTDTTLEHLRNDDNIFHIENTHNLGFAAGFNIGLSMIDTPYFIICNSDVVATNNWLKRMIEHLSEDPYLMAIGPKSNYVSGPQMVAGCDYTSAHDLVEYAKKFASSSIEPITYFKRLVFFCTVFRKQALEKIGFLDEIFEGGNFEDDDYCLRIHKKGYKTAIDNTVFIHHYGSQTFKENKIDFKTTMEINSKKFLIKHNFKSLQEYYRQLNA